MRLVGALVLVFAAGAAWGFIAAELIDRVPWWAVGVIASLIGLVGAAIYTYDRRRPPGGRRSTVTRLRALSD